MTEPTSATITYQPNLAPYYQDTTATYACTQVGYEIKAGDSVRTCVIDSVDDGTTRWTGTEAVCGKIGTANT